MLSFRFPSIPPSPSIYNKPHLRHHAVWNCLLLLLLHASLLPRVNNWHAHFDTPNCMDISFENWVHNFSNLFNPVTIATYKFKSSTKKRWERLSCIYVFLYICMCICQKFENNPSYVTISAVRLYINVASLIYFLSPSTRIHCIFPCITKIWYHLEHKSGKTSFFILVCWFILVEHCCHPRGAASKQAIFICLPRLGFPW